MIVLKPGLTSMKFFQNQLSSWLTNLEHSKNKGGADRWHRFVALNNIGVVNKVLRALNSKVRSKVVQLKDSSFSPVVELLPSNRKLC